MNSNNSVASYIIPPIIVGIAVVIKDVFIDGYSVSDEIVMTDVGINISAYLISDVFVEFVVNRAFTNTSGAGQSVLESGSDIVMQPLIQGLICAVVRPLVHTRQTLITHPITFTSSFVDGLIYNILGKYLSSPILNAL
jgi:hypothetical protein